MSVSQILDGNGTIDGTFLFSSLGEFSGNFILQATGSSPSNILYNGHYENVASSDFVTVYIPRMTFTNVGSANVVQANLGNMPSGLHPQVAQYCACGFVSNTNLSNPTFYSATMYVSTSGFLELYLVDAVPSGSGLTFGGTTFTYSLNF